MDTMVRKPSPRLGRQEAATGASIRAARGAGNSRDSRLRMRGMVGKMVYFASSMAHLASC